MTEETVDSLSPETSEEDNEEITNLPTEAVAKTNKFNGRRGLFRTKRQRVQIKPTDDPVRTLHIPSMTPQMIEEQQHRFNTFLQQTHDFQIAAVDSGRAALYRIHHEAGLGNIIRGYLTTFTIAILSNRTVQSILFLNLLMVVKTRNAMIFRFFVPPFPEMNPKHQGIKKSSFINSCQSKYNKSDLGICPAVCFQQSSADDTF